MSDLFELPPSGVGIDRRGSQPLGELLVDHGLLTQAQLDAALLAQQQTGRPLGEIVVSRGFVSGAMVAQALATQRGGLTRTEYGYATGFASGPAAAAVVAPPPFSAQPDGPVEPAPAASPASAPDPEAEALRAGLGDALAHVSILEEQLVQARASAEADAARCAAETDSLRSRLDDAEARARLLETELADAGATIETMRDELVNALRGAPADRPETGDVPEHGHLVFTSGPDAYRLVERDGPPPAVGDDVQLDGVRHHVVRIGAAPVPNAGRRCAYTIPR